MGKNTERKERPPRGPRRAGQQAGFAVLAFEQFGAGLYRYLLRQLRHRDTAEDLAQEVYLRLLRFADQELVRSPKDYVYRVAFNVLHEFRLHEQRRPAAFDSESLAAAGEKLPDEVATVEELCEQRDHERKLDQALEQVPPAQRAVFVLAMRHDMPHADIARELGLTLNTVRKYLYRTLYHCRQQLSGEQGI